jgi:hypothetical protein
MSVLETRPRLNELLWQVVGKRCWDVSYSDGIPHQLEIGGRRDVGSKRHPDLRLGELGFVFWDVDIRLYIGCSLIARGIEEWGGLKAEVLAAEANEETLELSLTFRNHVRLVVIPEVGDLFWEYFMPDNMMIAAGEGPKWSLKSARK